MSSSGLQVQRVIGRDPAFLVSEFLGHLPGSCYRPACSLDRRRYCLSCDVDLRVVNTAWVDKDKADNPNADQQVRALLFKKADPALCQVPIFCGALCNTITDCSNRYDPKLYHVVEHWASRPHRPTREGVEVRVAPTAVYRKSPGEPPVLVLEGYTQEDLRLDRIRFSTAVGTLIDMQLDEDSDSEQVDIIPKMKTYAHQDKTKPTIFSYEEETAYIITHLRSQMATIDIRLFARDSPDMAWFHNYVDETTRIMHEFKTFADHYSNHESADDSEFQERTMERMGDVQSAMQKMMSKFNAMARESDQLAIKRLLLCTKDLMKSYPFAQGMAGGEQQRILNRSRHAVQWTWVHHPLNPRNPEGNLARRMARDYEEMFRVSLSRLL